MAVVANHEIDIFHVNLRPENVPELSEADLELITSLWLQDLDDAIVPRPNGADDIEEDGDVPSEDEPSDENEPSDGDEPSDEEEPSNDNENSDGDEPSGEAEPSAVAHDLGDEPDNGQDRQQLPAQNADAPDVDRANLNGSAAGEEEAPGDENLATEADRQPEENPAPQPSTPTTSNRSSWASFLGGFLYAPATFISEIASKVTTPREIEVAHCVVCDEDVTSFVRVPCRDVYCITCLYQLFELATNDESLMPPRCCRQEIPLTLVTSHLSASLRNKFRRKLEEHNTLNRLYCIRPSCAAFIGSADGPRRIVWCPACYARVCTSCKKDAHPSACKQDRETENAIEFCRQQGWQRCPGCQGMIELSHGCYHMTCVCRTEFCYLCRARWKSCRCAQWDERRLLIVAEERVQDEIRRAVPNPAPPVRVVNQPIQRAEQFVNHLQAAQVQRPPFPARAPVQLAQNNGNQPIRPANPLPAQIPIQYVRNGNEWIWRDAIPPVLHARDQIPRPFVVPNPIRPAQNNNQPVQRAGPQAVRPLVLGVGDQIQRPVVPNPIRPVQNNQSAQRAGLVNVTPPVAVRDQVPRPRLLVVPTPARPVQNNNQPVERAGSITPAISQIRRPQAPVTPTPIRPVQNNNQPVQRVIHVTPAVPEARRSLVVPNPIQPTPTNLSRRARDQMMRGVAPPQTEDYAARVRAMMNHLRENHDCQHPHWYREAGAAKCESCFHRLDIFILRCRQCRMRACVRCRRNRL